MDNVIPIKKDGEIYHNGYNDGFEEAQKLSAYYARNRARKGWRNAILAAVLGIAVCFWTAMYMIIKGPPDARD